MVFASEVTVELAKL